MHRLATCLMLVAATPTVSAQESLSVTLQDRLTAGLMAAYQRRIASDN